MRYVLRAAGNPQPSFATRTPSTVRKTLAASGVFLLFLLSGGGWVLVAGLIPDGLPRSIALLALGVAFVGVFGWLLISRVRQMLLAPSDLWKHLAISFFQLLLVILAFAWVYHHVGIVDNTAEGSPVTHSLLTSIYYSVATFTTLGYGDFYPRGIGRALAALEALTGYLILGILASTGASLLKPSDEERKAYMSDD